MKKITEETFIPKELGDDIIKRVDIFLNQGIPDVKAVRLGVYFAIEKWKEKHADKSGG